MDTEIRNTTLILLLVGGIVLILSMALGAAECSSKYESFNNKYGLLSGCQIELDGKWIPADSYYFKEE